MRVDPRDPWTVLAVVLTAVLVRLLALPAPVRPLVLGTFLLTVPGAALLAAVPWPRLAWWTGVVACSLAISVLTSTVLLYAGVWTPDRVLAVLATGSALGCAVHLRARRREHAP